MAYPSSGFIGCVRLCLDPVSKISAYSRTLETVCVLALIRVPRPMIPCRSLLHQALSQPAVQRSGKHSAKNRLPSGMPSNLLAGSWFVGNSDIQWPAALRGDLGREVITDQPGVDRR
jgi:hypothetical protein